MGLTGDRPVWTALTCIASALFTRGVTERKGQREAPVQGDPASSRRCARAWVSPGRAAFQRAEAQPGGSRLSAPWRSPPVQAEGGDGQTERLHLPGRGRDLFAWLAAPDRRPHAALGPLPVPRGTRTASSHRFRAVARRSRQVSAPLQIRLRPSCFSSPGV